MTESRQGAEVIAPDAVPHDGQGVHGKCLPLGNAKGSAGSSVHIDGGPVTIAEYTMPGPSLSGGSLTRGDILIELRRQHRLQIRLGYDGHNRRPIAITMRRLGLRRRRRRGRERLRGLILQLQFATRIN